MSNCERISANRKVARECSGLPGTAQWIFLLFFVAVSSGLFAVLYEWQRYQLAVPWHMLGVGPWGKTAVVWLLWAKSIFILIPILAISGLLIRLKLRGPAVVILGFGWTVFFSWMAIDVDLLNHTGMHAVDYFPYLYDMMSAPKRNYGNWLVEDLLPQAGLTLFAIGAGGYILYRFLHYCWARWLIVYLRGVLGLITASALLTACVIPALAATVNRRALHHVYQTLPIASDKLETLTEWAKKGLDSVKLVRSPVSGVWIQSLAFLPDGRQCVTLKNAMTTKASLEGCRLQNAAADCLPINGMVPAQSIMEIILDGNLLRLDLSGDHLLLIDGQGWVRSRVSYTTDDLQPGRALVFEANEAGPFDVHVAREAEHLPPGLMEAPLDHKDVDAAEAVAGSARPNVVIIVLESFRHPIVGSGALKRLDAFAEKGLIAHRHFSGSNCTQYGFFSLLYGRVALDYDETLNRQIPPRMTAILRDAGYRCTFVASGEYRGFRRMDDFINERTFDECLMGDKGASEDYRSWPRDDRVVFEKVRSVLSSGQGPHFVVAYLYSTHYPYVFPPEFDVRKPSKRISAYGLKLRSAPATDMLNRYGNAALFMEDEIVRLVESVDPTRNVFVITGDHGESIGEDGVLGHGSLLSEIQIRVPFVMFGPGIARKKISATTSHVDVLPTLLHHLCGRQLSLADCYGRDFAEGDPPDTGILAVPWRWWDHKELLSLQREKRRLFKLKRNNNKEELVFSGLIDQFGRLE